MSRVQGTCLVGNISVLLCLYNLRKAYIYLPQHKTKSSESMYIVFQALTKQKAFIYRTSRTFVFKTFFVVEIESAVVMVIKPFSCSTQLRLKFILLIKVKMPTIVGILTFMSS